jgi:hypothetical protein
LVNVHDGSLGYAQRHEPKQMRRPWSSPTVRAQLAGHASSLAAIRALRPGTVAEGEGRVTS